MRQLYQSVFENSKEVIMIVEKDSGQIIDANQAACDLYQYTKEEFLKLEKKNLCTDSEGCFDVTKNSSLCYHCKKDGSRFPVNISTSDFEENNSSYVTIFVRDLSNENTEQSLKDANILLNTLFNRSPLAIIFLDINGNVKMWNHSAETIFGWTAGEVLGKPNPIVPSEKAAEYKELSNEVISHGEITGREMIRQRKDGTLINISLSSSAVYNQKGQLIGRMAISEDITQRKHNEDLISQNEAIFSAFLENSPIYVFFKDKENKALRLSKNFEKMLGMKVENALGKAMDELFPPDMAKTMIADDHKVMSEGKRLYVVEEFNGRIFTSIKFPIFKDGHPFMLAGFTQEMTEQQQMTEQLEMLKHSIDIHFDGAYWMDTDNRFVYVNEAGCNALQYSREELLTMQLPDVNDLATPEIMEDVWNMLRKNKFYVTEALHKRKDGTEFPVEISATYVKFGNKEFNCGFARDITERKKVEKELQESEARLNSLIHNRNESIWSIDKNYRYVILNDNFIKSYLAAYQIVLEPGMHINQTIPPHLVDFWLSKYKTALAGETVEFEFSESLFGATRFFLVNITPIFVNDNVIGASVIAIDSTNRKKGEEALQQSEEKFRMMAEALKYERNQLRTLIDNLPDLIYFKDTEGKYLLNNLAHLQSLGKEKQEEVLNKSTLDVHPEQLANIYIHDEMAIVNTGEPLLNREELAFNHKKNEQRWHLTNKYPSKDINGKVTGIIGISRDITDLKITNEILKASEEKYRLLFENMTAGFALHEMLFDEKDNPYDYRFLEINPAFEKLTGLKAANILGKKVSEALPNIEQHWINFYGNVAKTGNAASYQNYAQDLKKHYDVWVFCPKTGQFATIINDVTKQKMIEEAINQQNEEYQALNQEYLVLNEELIESNNRLVKINQDLEKAKQKAEESDNLKSAFLCNMSHEIRTPMNAILGFSEIITQPTLPESKKLHFSKLIKDRTYDLLRIIEDILDISKIEIGQMSLIESETNIKILLQELFDYYMMRKETQKQDPNLTILLNIDPTITNPVMLVDGSRLRQILMNLLDNSLKFTQKGSIELGCSLTSSSEVQFTVFDTGIGIPPDKKEIVFDRFRQAEDLHTSRHFGGTGLGLSIAKGLTHLMGGEIWLESEINVGTRFYLTIPYKPTTVTGKEDSNHKKLMKKKWEHKTFLIVEDDESSAVLMNEIISPTSANIMNAYNGKEAMQLFQENKINLVLLDIRLPDTDGLTIARKMKILKPDIPIIAQTAYATDNDTKACIEAGCNAYVSKPINTEKLLELIQHLLK